MVQKLSEKSYIRQHHGSGLWCRPDGAVLMPPCKRIRRPRHVWAYGSVAPDGYLKIRHKGVYYYVHRLIAETFLGSAPEGKPYIDHIDRCKSNNQVSNLRWVNSKENNDNRQRIDDSLEKYGVRAYQDPKAYYKALYHNNPKARERVLARSRKWSAENSEKVRAYGRKQREEHHDRCLAYGRAYRERKKLHKNGAEVTRELVGMAE